MAIHPHTSVNLGFRVTPKANSGPEQGSFGGQSAVTPKTTTLQGQGEHLQQAAQSRLCKLLAACTIFTLVSVENEQLCAIPVRTEQLRCREISCHSKTAQASSSSLHKTSRGRGPAEQRRGL